MKKSTYHDPVSRVSLTLEFRPFYLEGAETMFSLTYLCDLQGKFPKFPQVSLLFPKPAKVAGNLASLRERRPRFPYRPHLG